MDDKKRQLLYRAGHRGTKELDILLGRYAENHIADMSAPDIEVFETFMEESEPVIYSWLTEAVEPPEAYKSLIKAILFNQKQYI